MPLYEYECDANGHRFEKIQKFSDPPIAECPVCGSPVHKLMSSPAIQFKGSGWYITDYAKKESTKAGKAGGSTNDGSSDKPGEAKGDSGKSDAGKSESSTPSAPAPASSDTKKD